MMVVIGIIAIITQWAVPGIKKLYEDFKVKETYGKFNFQLQPPCKSLRQREKCCAGEAKLRHFLGLVLIFCRQSARYAAV